ncbi:MAG TPA: hypothetical protein VJ715_14850 [Pyrinomonadaceae bacterium]|nr:hypothetical protein [Pyrinomonadaceae bacterium]
MKKVALVAVLLLVAIVPASAQKSVAARDDYGLPELHVIKTVTLSPSYSCRPEEEFQKGYEGTALFLSDYSKRRNSPDLLFNGGCRSADEFESSTAGDDMALIADLGADTPIETLTAHLAFNKKNMAETYSKFAQQAKVAVNHTYVVLLNKSEIRGLFVFTVTNLVPNKRVDLRYAVKQYQVMDVKEQSPGFDWGQENSAVESNPVVEKARGGKEN